MSKKKLLNELSEINIKDFVSEEYKTYQMYSLMDRALPYFIDGLKPSQRRILYTYFKYKSKGLMKVSSAGGLVMSLHPHGNKSIEDAIVKLAQDYTFSNNYPLLDKKGYFGERMETSPAAPRYIEAKISELAMNILFDDMNQVQMELSYDDRSEEPKFLLPKIPLVLINGTEGIGTGFSCMIPSFHHKDVIQNMISHLENKKLKKMTPWYNFYKEKVIYEKEKSRYIFPMKIELIKGKYFITELPKGYDKQKISTHLKKLLELELLKDYVDVCSEKEISIELIFRKGQKLSLSKVEEIVRIDSTLTPNYTFATDEGVHIFQDENEIIKLFTDFRLDVIKKRYELKVKDLTESIQYNNEIIRFIKDKHYQVAEKKKNKSEFTDYLKSKKFVNINQLSELAVYRMTKEEIEKRQILVKEENILLKEFKSILKSKDSIKKNLIDELNSVDKYLSDYLKKTNR